MPPPMFPADGEYHDSAYEFMAELKQRPCPNCALREQEYIKALKQVDKSLRRLQQMIDRIAIEGGG
jgi:hypothetical protein